MSRLLCLLGFHKWIGPYLHDLTTPFIFFCDRCGKESK